MTSVMALPVAQDLPAGSAEQLRPIRFHLWLAFAALAIGGLMGLQQAMERLDVNTYVDGGGQTGIGNYYQGLTVHGVMLALVFTFSFANSFLSLTTIKGFERPLASTAILWASWISAALGTAIATVPILANKATVLFTFYTPLEANPAFYLGAVGLILSTWLTSLNQLLTLRQWRQDNPGERSPLLAYTSIMTYLMWNIATIGIAIEVVVFVLPWSLGMWNGTDPEFNRILFWFTGHPIVYFWLLPIYVSWYMCIPKQAGGKLFSDSLVRLVFILLLLLSTPVGLHHQFTDPGIDTGLKFIHMLLTFGVFFPSVITAFTLMAALESGGRARGGTGLLGWIGKLPWRNPSFVAQIVAMLAFVLGGISGLVNASGTLNLVVHNTAFIVGHFHMTVGTAVTLSVMGIAYWLVPYLTGHQLWGSKVALAQAWLWGIGILLFARGQMAGGIDGMPRRTLINEASYIDAVDWDLANLMTGLGGVTMVVSGLLFFVVMIMTLAKRVPVESAQDLEFPLSETEHGKVTTMPELDRIGLWTGLAFALVCIAYIPVVIDYAPVELTSPGFSLW